MPKKALRSSKRTPLRCTTSAGVRRFFFKLELLGKRRTDLPFDYSNLDPIVDTPPEKVSARDTMHSSHAYGKKNKSFLPPSALAPTLPIHNIPCPERVALMNEDYTEDAIVITTLDTVPFCCHEDLITMSRKQIVGVALFLNARLPAALAIDTDEVLPTSWIRESIEKVVGIRADVPGAPRVVKVLRDSNRASEGNRTGTALGSVVGKMDRTPPTSPLASRSQQLGSLISPGLDRLVEEDEGEDEDEEADRHSKKRKLTFDDTGSESDSDVVMASDPEQTPTPLPRLQRARSCVLSVKILPSPTSTRVLRSHSQTIGKTAAIDTSFMYDGRPQARYQRKATKEKVEARTDQEASLPIGAPRRSGRLRPISRPPVVSAEPSTVPHLEVPIGAKRKRNVSSSGREAARYVMSGINNMTMGSGSEWPWDSDGMDISV